MPTGNSSMNQELKGLERRIREALAGAFMETEAGPFGVACSGGLDSTLLLQAMARFFPEKNLRILHVDHAIRPWQERAAEQALLLEISLATGWCLYVHTLEPGAVQSLAVQKGGTEAAARHLRYQAMDSWASGLGLDRIFMAHHGDDLSESRIMAWLQGQDTGGCLPSRRGIYDRPLMDFTRDEILFMAREWGLTWHDESTNEGRDYLRNKVRHDLVPLVREIFPGYRRALARQSLIAESDTIFFDKLLQSYSWKPVTVQAYRQNGVPADGTPGLGFDMQELLGFPDALAWRFLRKGASFFLEAQEIQRLPEPEACMELVSKLRCGSAEDVCTLGPLSLVVQDSWLCLASCIVVAHKNDYLVLVDQPGFCEIPGLGSMRVERTGLFELFPLVLRPAVQWIQSGEWAPGELRDFQKKLALLERSHHVECTDVWGRIPGGKWIVFSRPWKGAWVYQGMSEQDMFCIDTIACAKESEF